MSVEAVARKWHDQILRTDPIDHEKAEAALRKAYGAAGIPEPKYFLWCLSPAEAVLAYLVLVGRTDSYNRAVYEDAERSKSGKEKLAKARALVAAKLGIAEGEVEGYFGKPFYVAEGSNPISKKLQENLDAWMARAQAGDDFLSAHKGGPFKLLYDLEQSLHHEGQKSRDGGLRGSLMQEALSSTVGKNVCILGGRSAIHRLYGNIAYSEVAQDEALAAIGSLEPDDLRLAMWDAYEATGMWWPCLEGVVFAERPVDAEKLGDALGLRWADGFTLGEISGAPQAIEPTAEAKAETAERPSDAAILSYPLPSDHDQRIAKLRSLGPLPFFDRYLEGEHEDVWKELVALGDKVRSEDYAADAMAVAYETMHRVEQNVRLLAERLRALNYRFVYPGSDGSLFGLRKAKEHEPLAAPPAKVRDQIADLEAQAGGPIPLALRAFFEVVGEVNFNGDHPSLAPKQSDVAPDPLMVCSVEEALACVDMYEREEDEPLTLDFAPDALHKANVSGGDPYSFAVPNGAADALVEGEPHGVNFVEYLRIAIAWGGFPGWEGQASCPSEIERLREGLRPF